MTDYRQRDDLAKPRLTRGSELRALTGAATAIGVPPWMHEQGRPLSRYGMPSHAELVHALFFAAHH